jgi:hypothetical protein
MIEYFLDPTKEYTIYVNGERVHEGKGISRVAIEEDKDETGTVSEGYEQLELPGIL